MTRVFVKASKNLKLPPSGCERGPKSHGRTQKRGFDVAPHALSPAVAVNPGSTLGTKMVKEAYGVAGGDARRGAETLRRAALSDEFAAASGQYFDNDSGQFATPHPDALDARKCEQVVHGVEAILAGHRKE